MNKNRHALRQNARIPHLGTILTVSDPKYSESDLRADQETQALFVMVVSGLGDDPTTPELHMAMEMFVRMSKLSPDLQARIREELGIVRGRHAIAGGFDEINTTKTP